MAGETFKAQSRAKDAMIIPLSETTTETTHMLRFYDCNCGSIRQITGKIIETGNERIVFRVGAGKKFILEKITRPTN
jgi:hypothetical protein